MDLPLHGKIPGSGSETAEQAHMYEMRSQECTEGNKMQEMQFQGFEAQVERGIDNLFFV